MAQYGCCYNMQELATARRYGIVVTAVRTI
jgi:hypothetical protein